jgi:hypothetical protein
MVEIPEVSNADLVFGPQNIGKILPAWSELPEEYRKGWSRGYGGCKLASELFCNGGRLPEPKEGVDAKRASRAIQACLMSFDPSHEHKIAGVGFLLEQWFKI